MHYHTRSTFGRAATLVALMLTTMVCCSCSRGARVARLLEQANRHFEAGEFEKAEIEYKNVLKKDAQNGSATSRLGLLYHAQGRDARAATYLLRARELQPDNVDVSLALALAHLGGGGLKEAREEILNVLQRRPADDQAPLILVQASATPQELDQAEQRLQALPEPAANSAAVRIALGNIALRRNRPPEAAAAFNAVLATDPKCAAAHAALGTLRLAQNDLAGADAAFKQAAELSSVRSPRRLHYAQFKLQTGDLPAAKRLLDEIGQQAPDYFPVWLWLAEIALAEKKPEAADALLAKALAQEPQHAEALLINARVRLARGETAKAVAELERLQSAFPKSAQIAYQLGLAYIAAGDANKAITRLTQVTAAAPEMIPAALTLAELQMKKRDFPAALAVLKPLVQQRPELTAARLMLAEAHRGQGNLDEAAALYAEMQKQRPTDAQVAFARGTVLLQQRNRTGARAEFEKAIQLEPGHIAALEQLSELDLHENAAPRARQRLEAALQQNPRSAPLALMLGKVCSALADSTAAEAAFKQAIELQPNWTDAHYCLARFYVSTQQQDKAVANLQDATRRNPQNLAPHLLLGILLDERKDHAGARDAYEKALTLDPKSSLALNNLAYLYTEVFDQADRAVELAQRARALQPNEPRTADTLGWALAKKKRYAEALGVLQESAAKLPDEPEARYHLGMVHYMLGDEPAARAALQHAADRKADLPWVNDARQRLALLNLDPATPSATSRALIEKRLAERPDDPVALLRAGEFERRQGNSDKALAHFQAILQGNPKHALALINVARFHAAKSDFPKAMELAKAARNAAPSNLEVTHGVGRIAYEAGDHRWAASLLQEVAKARADDPEVLFDFAQACYSVGRVADAESHLRRALTLKNFTRAAAAERFLEMTTLASDAARAASEAAKIDATLRAEPLLTPALLARAVAAEQAGQSVAARKHYEDLLGHYPDFTPAQRNLTILYATNAADAAIASAIANKARQAFPQDAALARAAGIIAYRQTEFGKAANLLQDAVNKDNRDSEALYYLGMAQGRLNKHSESKQTLQRALDAGLKDTLATEAKKTLARSD